LFWKRASRNDAAEVHTEVERPAEALHERNCARARRQRSRPAGQTALVGENNAQRDVRAGASALDFRVSDRRSMILAGVWC